MASTKRLEEDVVTVGGVIKGLNLKEERIVQRLSEAGTSSSGAVVSKERNADAVLDNVRDYARVCTQQTAAASLLSRLLDALIAEKAGRSSVRSSAIINALDTHLPTWPGVPIAGCGAVPYDNADTQLQPGQEVAAYARGTGGMGVEPAWILAVCISILGDGRVVVEDVVEGTGSKRHSMPKRDIVPLPMWQPEPSTTYAFFPAGTRVLAMFPQTTCFYAATVHEAPTQSHRSDYILKFDDDTYDDGRIRHQTVPIKYVILPP